MKVAKTNILFLLLFGQILFAQDHFVSKLDEVQIYSRFSTESQVGYSIINLSDSLLTNRNDNLTSILKRHANIYIKEQGSGMTASISMRGTGASHTAVYWNGIPINSSLNGQTDFNTIFSASYNKISIRKGGGSVLLGSGAIGGAVNLKNELNFSNSTTGSVFGSLGSYQNINTAIEINHATNKSIIEVNYNTISAKNDYAYYNTDIKNENGEINHYAIQLNGALRLDNSNTVYIKTQYNNSNRNTSRTLYSTNNANLAYKTHTALIGWKSKINNFKSEFKSAYIKEDYTYIFDKKLPDYISKNASEKWYSNYHTNYKITNKLSLQSGLNYELLLGKGTDIDNSKRRKAAIYTSLQHVLSNFVIYNINVRKDWSSAYKIPLVFSIDSKQKWHKNHTTKFNISTNYKTPTINDLYWELSGNKDLKPEKNWSAEVGYEWQFVSNITTFGVLNSRLGLSLYNSQSSDLIQWVPVTNQFWKPINVQKVTTQGLEFDINTKLQKDNYLFSSKLQYSYTISKDQKLNKQLMYVPEHMGGMLFSFSTNNWIVDVEEKYNGKVYTTSTNTNSIEKYFLTNVSVKRYIGNNKFSLGLVVNNLTNTQYEIKLSRPMPKRNYSINFNYKF